jgi:hypothetical protein
MEDDLTTSQMQDEVPVDNSATDATTTDEPQEVDAVEEQTEDTVEAPATDEPNEEEPVEEPAPVSRRENKRIAELTRKLAESNQQRVQQPTQPQPRQIIGEGDYDLDQVNGLAQQYGEQRYNEGLAIANAQRFETRLEIDAPKVEAKYPVLNPRSEQFDPGIAEWSTQLYYKTVGLKPGSDGTFTVENPNIRYEEFADGLMEAVETLATSKSADSKVNLAKQAAQTGVRPTGVAKKQYSGTDPSKMTTAQLQAAINAQLGL